jgi:four helix bundle protein
MPIDDWRLPSVECRVASAERLERRAMDTQELKDRTKHFSLRVIKLVGALPNTVTGRAIGNQLVRSGTSVGANYRAACRGRSTAEFIAKLGTVEEEADESAFWMELIMDDGLLSKELVESLHREAGELTAIVAASRISASRNRAKAQRK